MRKPKLKIIKNMRASVSIMLSVLMLPVYTFAGVVTDGARISSAKQMTAGALDLSMNAALASYDDILKSVYGLFAMSKTEAELQDNLSEYFIRTVDNTALSQNDEETKEYMDSIMSFFSNPSNIDFDNLINLNTECFGSGFAEGAVLANPVVMKNQITEYMKYMGPLSLGSDFAKKLEVFEDFRNENEEIENKIEYSKDLDKIHKVCTEIYKNAYEYNSQVFISCISDISDDLSDAYGLYLNAVENFTLAKSEKFSGDDKAELRENLINEGNEFCRQAADIINSWYDFSVKSLSYLEKVKSSLDKFEKFADTPNTNDYYKDILNAFENGSFSEYKNITESNINSFKEMKEYFSGINFCGKDIRTYASYFDEYEGYIPENDFGSKEETIEFSEIFMNENYRYISSEIPAYCRKQGNEYEFYDSLSKLCGSSVSTTDEKSSKKFLETLKSLGDFSKVTGADISDAVSDNILSEISEDKLSQIKEISAYADIEESCTINSSNSSNSADILENQQNIMSTAADFIGDIGGLAKKAAGEGLENLYLMEYITEMFSCYTCDKEYSKGEVNEIKPETLSGIAISPENNVFYRSEAEYILWGSNDMHKNHLYTNSLLFGTRFTLNSIYAFRDAEIKAATFTAASAIAGWTGFGIPVVQTVLILSLSLAESVNDVNELLDGKAVAVYKTQETWKLKPSGIVSMLEDGAEELAKKDNSSDFDIDVSKGEEKQKNAVSLTYKEYIKIFILLSTFSEAKENAMLSRVGTLIHINMNNGMKNTGMNRETAFDICEAHTMITARSDVSVKTWFMGVFVPNYNMNIDGSTTYEYDFSNLGKKEKIISCQGLMSY